jgi:hypothetical protein
VFSVPPNTSTTTLPSQNGIEKVCNIGVVVETTTTTRETRALPRNRLYRLKNIAPLSATFLRARSEIQNYLLVQVRVNP